MKIRAFMLAVTALISILITNAQHLEVKKLSWWNPEYPTIVNAGVCNMHSDYWNNKFGFLSDYEVNATKEIAGVEDFAIASTAWEVGLLWTLTEIDGKDVRNFADDEWQSFWNNPNIHEWTWLTPYGTHKTNGFKCTDLKYIKTLNVDYDSAGKETYDIEKLNQKKYGYDVLIDWDVDWGKIRTFDFLLIGADPLTDKTILEEFAKNLEPYMRRDTDSPDVYITIAKDSKSSVSYSYIPPKVDYVKTGSTTKKVYNWVGQNPKYQTEDHYQRVESGGYTKEMNQSDIFLEICMLDASKLNRETPPIIYKAQVSKSYPSKVNALDKYLDFASLFQHPVSHKFIASKLKFDETIPYALRWGIASEGLPYGFMFSSKESPHKVAFIHRPSLRYISGDVPSPGDIIIKKKDKNFRVHSGEEWYDMELTYKDQYGKNKKFTILAVTESHGGFKKVVPYMGGDYWFRPYLITIAE